MRVGSFSKPVNADQIGTGFRPDIQGLRALAIAIVLLFHLWPNRVTGGFVGVDIFFVISGYLITGHLFKEVYKTGSIKLGQFWSRRIRRLLPLAFTVLASSFVILLFLMPSTTWPTNMRNMIASTLYVENWALAFDAVDYLAQDDTGNMVTHYWSLSVEEQFYVFLPLILFASVLVLRALKKTERTRATFIAVLTVVGIASFIHSVQFTMENQAQAYFFSTTRIWEFVVGGLVALIGIRIRGALGNILGYAGVAMILVAATLFSGASAFPGYIALLPIVGAALLLIAGDEREFVGIHWWASRKPFLKLGDWSYAIYLWHWPLIVLAQYSVEPFLWYHKLVVLVVSILLGWGSKHLIEDPARFAKPLQGTRPSLVMMASGMAVLVLCVSIIPTQIMKGQEGPTLATTDQCYGPAALKNDCW